MILFLTTVGLTEVTAVVGDGSIEEISLIAILVDFLMLFSDYSLA